MSTKSFLKIFPEKQDRLHWVVEDIKNLVVFLAPGGFRKAKSRFQALEDKKIFLKKTIDEF